MRIQPGIANWIIGVDLSRGGSLVIQNSKSWARLAIL
jgi:hypothetical protein